MSAVSHSIAPTEPAQTAQGHSGTPQPISGPQNGAERDELAAALVRQICISTELRRERDEARAAVSRLNRRVQVAESAIAELTGTGEGKASQVSREIWTRCEESHGLLCATTSRARGTAVALEAENARLTEEVAVPDVSASPRHPDAPGATAGGSVMRQRMTNSPRWHSDTPHPMNGPQNGEPQ